MKPPCSLELDLQLRRPARIQRGRWLDVLIDAFHGGQVPHVRCFSIGPDHGEISMCIPQDRAGSSSCFAVALAAVAAALAKLEDARLDGPAPAPMALPRAGTEAPRNNTSAPR